ncbi:MAG: carboxypeptidase-like regulatory domain-containing protein, partial [Methanolobus sp.]|uniref:MSCRAMM family protein n=1 Tax=Methanolobus sp. TaxID=1874737 RepID=UPI002731F52B
MQVKSIAVLLLSVLLLASLATPVSADELKFVANATSDENGEFILTDIPNGNYTLSGIIWSTAMSGMWLTNVQEITIENGQPVEDIVMEMRKNDSIDHDAILSMLHRTTISGTTVDKNKAIKPETNLILTDKDGKFILNATSDVNGQFVLENIMNGEYTLSGIIWSTAMSSMWLTNVQEITVENGQPVENIVMEMRKNDSIDHNAILNMLHRTTISGNTVDKNKAIKPETKLILTDKDGEFVLNATSDANGEFVLENIMNGEYTLSGMIWSTAMSGMWLTNVQEITVENGQPVENIVMEMRKNDSIDHDAILSMLDRTTISGKTVDKNENNRPGVQLVLTKKIEETAAPEPDKPIVSTYEYEFILSATSDENGEFVLTEIPNGEYTLSGIIWSTAMSGMWLTNVQEITVEDGQPVENIVMEMRKNDSIDHDAILNMLDRTTISGTTVDKNGGIKPGTQLLLTNEEGQFV